MYRLVAHKCIIGSLHASNTAKLWGTWIVRTSLLEDPDAIMPWVRIAAWHAKQRPLSSLDSQGKELQATHSNARVQQTQRVLALGMPTEQ